MRRTFAVLLVLCLATPAFSRPVDQSPRLREPGLIVKIKKVIRAFLTAPDDDTIRPPRP
jgi:hypothetical protein